MSELTMQDERPTDGEILALLIEHFDAKPHEVLCWLDTFDGAGAVFEYRAILGIQQESA